MRLDTASLLSSLHTPPPILTPWEWARDNLDYSRIPSYDSQKKSGYYDPDYMPYWKEVVESAFDPEIREVWVLKHSRAGATENVLLNAIRFAIFQAPQQTLYVTQDQVSAERLMSKRIKLSLQASTVTAKKLLDARSTETEIDFNDMTLVCSYVGKKSLYRQDGYALILGDEVSTWPDFSADLLRRRQANYPLSHLVCVSSPDATKNRPPSEDPILREIYGTKEVEGTDQRVYMMPDPITGTLFNFVKGSKDTNFGLRWDPSAKDIDTGKWDLQRVRESAYYLTPDGTTITEDQRWSLIEKGKWVASNTKAPKHKRGYIINSFYSPYQTFGDIAVAFLTANALGKEPLKRFVCEYLAEPFAQSIEKSTADEVADQCRQYKLGNSFSDSEQFKDFYIGKEKIVYVSVDVQKLHLYYCVREWVDGGDSGLIDFGACASWDDVEGKATDYRADKVFVDCGYPRRKLEAYEYCLRCMAIPTIGSDSQHVPIQARKLDPFEGTIGAGEHEICLYMFKPTIFKSMLMDLMKGRDPNHSWYLPKDVTREYLKQVTAEQLLGDKWEKVRDDNHGFDCEVLQLLAATIDRYYRTPWS